MQIPHSTTIEGGEKENLHNSIGNIPIESLKENVPNHSEEGKEEVMQKEKGSQLLKSENKGSTEKE